jgi:hypothetical protein
MQNKDPAQAMTIEKPGPALITRTRRLDQNIDILHKVIDRVYVAARAA